jgi:hypothetical protein
MFKKYERSNDGKKHKVAVLFGFSQEHAPKILFGVQLRRLGVVSCKYSQEHVSAMILGEV